MIEVKKTWVGHLYGPAVRIGSGYLEEVVANTAQFVKVTEEKLLEVDFDTVVCTGLSGLLVAPGVAAGLGKKLLVVRKPDDSTTHSQFGAEGWLGKRWLFLDDKISSGKTLQRVQEAVAKITAGTSGFTTEYAGSYEYLYNWLKLEPQLVAA